LPGRWSLWSEDSFLSIASTGSVLSIGSVRSALSIGSIGSAASALSIGSFASVGCLASALSGFARRFCRDPDRYVGRVQRITATTESARRTRRRRSDASRTRVPASQVGAVGHDRPHELWWRRQVDGNSNDGRVTVSELGSGPVATVTTARAVGRLTECPGGQPPCSFARIAAPGQPLPSFPTADASVAGDAKGRPSAVVHQPIGPDPDGMRYSVVGSDGDLSEVITTKKPEGWVVTVTIGC
jgi:hypothetical protein